MKIGDLVQYRKDGPTMAKHVGNKAVIIHLDDTHRQCWVDLLMDNGNIVNRVWASQLEIISES